MAKVCVFGAGAVGQYLTVKLSSVPGLHLQAVCRGSTYKAIKRAGCITLDDDSDCKVTTATNFTLIHSSEIASAGSQDFIITCLKGDQMVEAIPQLQSLMHEDTTLAVLQNGLPFYHNSACSHPALASQPLQSIDPGAQLLTAFNPAECNVAGCVSHIAAAKSAPGTVKCTSKPGAVSFMLGGVGMVADDKIDALVRLLQRASVQVTKEPALLRCIWTKVCISAAVNTTNLLTAGYCDDLIHDESMVALLRNLFKEVISIGNAAGAGLTFSVEDEVEYCRKRFPHCKFSMLQDAEAGRRLEVGPYLLAVQEVASMVGVARPTLDTISTLVRHYDSNIARRLQDGYAA